MPGRLLSKIKSKIVKAGRWTFGKTRFFRFGPAGAYSVQDKVKATKTRIRAANVHEFSAAR